MGADIIAGYQNAFSDKIGVSHAYAFWKGRVALYAILRALRIGAGDEVILPGFTCVVVPNAIRFAGATPVFVDITPGTYNLDPDAVERAITPRTRAVLVQHTFGIPADLDRLLDIARRHQAFVIEDCAHAVGSSYRGKAMGTFGIAAFFSSQWSKPYTTGLGGLAVTSDPDVANRLKDICDQFFDPPRSHLMRLRVQYGIYRRFFRPRLYWIAVGALNRLSALNLFVGSSGSQELDSVMPPDTNWRMSAFQAQIGLEQLQTLSQNVDHRRRVARFYREYLNLRGWEEVEIERAEARSVLVRFPVRAANKVDLLRKARNARVELGSWFESVLHPIKSDLGRFGYSRGQCPVAERAASETLNLPLHLRVSTDEAERIVEFVCKEAARPLPYDSVCAVS